MAASVFCAAAFSPSPYDTAFSEGSGSQSVFAGSSPITVTSPSYTRITFPTCRAHYPGGSSGCSCRLLPRSHGLPQMAGGSASALSLSRPAQASHALRPAGSLSRPKATFVTRLQPVQLPARAARQLPDQSTTLRVESSPTDDARLPGALPQPDSCTAANTSLVYSITSSATPNSLCMCRSPSSAWTRGLARRNRRHRR